MLCLTNCRIKIGRKNGFLLTLEIPNNILSFFGIIIHETLINNRKPFFCPRIFILVCSDLRCRITLIHLETVPFNPIFKGNDQTIKGNDPPQIANISCVHVPLSIVYCTLQYKSFVTSVNSPFFFFCFTSFSFNFYVDIHYSPLNH